MNVSPVTDVVQWDLGAGETAVWSFASKEKAYTAVLDDLQAKKCAQSLSISAIGTGTILILAKEKQLIKSVGTALEQLRQSGLWISTPVINLLKQQAGEDI
ncbi:MAG: DUF3368 domain-containing protein [Anaerolineales bacterium]|nr:DUF3368 domain-containing protein [Anaerolineales bacterium]